MPWSDDDGAGFSSVKPWLPIPNCHRALAVSHQEVDPESVLNGFRAFMSWRRTQEALRVGDIRFLDAPEPLLVFTRACAGRTTLVAMNLGAEATSIPVPDSFVLRQTECPGPRNGRVEPHKLVLPGHAVIYADATDRTRA